MARVRPASSVPDGRWQRGAIWVAASRAKAAGRGCIGRSGGKEGRRLCHAVPRKRRPRVWPAAARPDCPSRGERAPHVLRLARGGVNAGPGLSRTRAAGHGPPGSDPHCAGALATTSLGLAVPTCERETMATYATGSPRELNEFPAARCARRGAWHGAGAARAFAG